MSTKEEPKRENSTSHSDSNKDAKFYAEVVIVTVIAILAANLLTEGIRIYLHRKYPKNALIWVLLSLIVGTSSILIIWKIFGSKHDSPYVRNSGAF